MRQWQRLLILSTIIQVARSMNYGFDGIDKSARPVGDDGKTSVGLTMYVRSLDVVDTHREEVQMQITFRMSWEDNRLKTIKIPDDRKFLQVPNDDIDQIWHPDVYFKHSRSIVQHNTIYPDSYLRIFSNSYVLSSKRMTFLLHCPMSLSKFPFDRQTCLLTVESYGHTYDEIMFGWKNNSVKVSKSLSNHNFTMEYSKEGFCTSVTKTGVYSCASVKFTFRRLTRQYLIKFIIPGFLVVCFSWSLFLFSPTNNAARIVILLLCYAVQGFLVYWSCLNRPPVGYVTALDIWNGICMAFLMAEMLVVFKMYSETRIDKKYYLGADSKGMSPLIEEADSARVSISDEGTIPTIWRSVCPSLLQFSLTLEDRTVGTIFSLSYLTTVAIYFLACAT